MRISFTCGKFSENCSGITYKNNKRTFLLLAVLALMFNRHIYSQPSLKALLVHSRYDVKDSTNEYLVAYIFINGVFEKRDTLLHTFRHPGSDADGRISVGLGREPVFFNRYLFTSTGLLIDLQEKKLLRRIGGEFWYRRGHQLYFSSKYHLDKVELFEYDLVKRSYRRVAMLPFENKQKFVAPDLKYAIKTDYLSTDKTRLSIVNTKGRPLPRSMAVLTKPLLHFGTHAQGKNPLLWLDNARVLYLNYRINNNGGWVFKKTPPGSDADFIIEKPERDTLPCCTGLLTEMNILNGKKRLIAEIPGLYAPVIDDRMILDDSNVVFTNSGLDTSQRLIIHTGTGVIKPWQPDTTGQFRIIRKAARDTVFNYSAASIEYQGRQTGDFNIQEYDTLNDYIAIYGSQKDIHGDNSIFVWTAPAGKWSRFNLDNFLQFFGWIDLNLQPLAPAPSSNAQKQKVL